MLALFHVQSFLHEEEMDAYHGSCVVRCKTMRMMSVAVANTIPIALLIQKSAGVLTVPQFRLRCQILYQILYQHLRQQPMVVLVVPGHVSK